MRPILGRAWLCCKGHPFGASRGPNWGGNSTQVACAVEMGGGSKPHLLEFLKKGCTLSFQAVDSYRLSYLRKVAPLQPRRPGRRIGRTEKTPLLRNFLSDGPGGRSVRST